MLCSAEPFGFAKAGLRPEAPLRCRTVSWKPESLKGTKVDTTRDYTEVGQGAKPRRTSEASELLSRASEASVRIDGFREDLFPLVAKQLLERSDQFQPSCSERSERKRLGIGREATVLL